MAIVKSNHTQVSNDFIDQWMAKIRPSSAVVFLAITRKTTGWHKDVDSISLTQLSEMTGLARQSVITAIGELEENGLIIADRSKTVTAYTINYCSPIIRPEEEIGSLKFRPGSPKIRPDEAETGLKFRHTKERLKETSTKESVGAHLDFVTPSPAKKRIPSLTLGECSNVRLTADELQRLNDEHGEGVVKEAIDFLSMWKEEKGRRIKNDNYALRRWAISAVHERRTRPGAQQTTRPEVLAEIRRVMGS
jgi:phage replication O-like protein O